MVRRGRTLQILSALMILSKQIGSVFRRFPCKGQMLHNTIVASGNLPNWPPNCRRMAATPASFASSCKINDPWCESQANERFAALGSSPAHPPHDGHFHANAPW
jgi:hypothetical protein